MGERKGRLKVLALEGADEHRGSQDARLGSTEPPYLRLIQHHLYTITS